MGGPLAPPGKNPGIILHHMLYPKESETSPVCNQPLTVDFLSLLSMVPGVTHIERTFKAWCQNSFVSKNTINPNPEWKEGEGSLVRKIN